MSDGTIAIDYAEPVEGPTLVFLVRSPSEVELLQKLFRSIPDRSRPLSLSLDPRFSLQGLTDLRLSPGGHPWLRRLSPNVFEWGGNSDGWESRAQLIDGLTKEGEFQFLDYEHAGDTQILVEFARTPGG